MQSYKENYLIHYGVLGMKWGQRRARINANKSAKASRKGNTEKAKKYGDKAKKIESKHRQRAGTKTYDRVKTKSTGKLLAQSMLMGTYGALNYQRAKAKGNSTGKAIVKGLLTGTANAHTPFGALSIVEPRVKTKNKVANKALGVIREK